MKCNHPSITCINHYEYIRKYRCDSCGEVMMCACDKEIAVRFLSHQTSEGVELETQERILVTLGFQENICNSCRGLPEEAHPKAELYGAATKIKRYYWREIAFETMRLFGDWAESQGYDDWLSARRQHEDKYAECEREALKHIKELHRKSPKYVYNEKSQNQIVQENEVEVVNLEGTYIKTSEPGVAILDGSKTYSAEAFVRRYYEKQGYDVLFIESVPFHGLFGVLMWILIQDPDDDHNRMVSFGNRSTFNEDEQAEPIWTLLPSDFGSSGYFARRQQAIEKHLESLPDSKDDLLWNFDYWIEPSYQLRQYLWAHRDEDVAKARQIIEVLPIQTLKSILRYLVEDYWQHYIGWPDLLVYKNDQFFFVEVKSSGDSLSADQKTWIQGNNSTLRLPFKLVKIHKTEQLDELPEIHQE